MRLLLEKGADINCYNSDPHNMFRVMLPLSIALRRQQIEIAKALLEKDAKISESDLAMAIELEGDQFDLVEMM